MQISEDAQSFIVGKKLNKIDLIDINYTNDDFLIKPK